MKLHNNYKLSTLLGLSHFITDAIAAFVLTIISIKALDKNDFFIDTYLGIEIAGYFIIYNFLAFFCQIFVGYFFDKIKNNTVFLSRSRNTVLLSFLFYIIGILLLNISYILSVVCVGIGSCLFHIGSGNIAISSEKQKATHLGIFASGGVVGLSFGGTLAFLGPNFIYILIVILLLLGYKIYTFRGYKIKTQRQDKIIVSSKFQHYIPGIIFGLALILVFRSTIWTHFQIEFSLQKSTLAFIAISAFFGKISGGILNDSRLFPNIYFSIIGIIALLSLYLYSYHINSIILLLLGIFGIQTSISPSTIALHNFLSQKRSEVIGFSFGLSLVIGFFLLNT